MPFCPNCGKEYPQGASFCPNCGKPFQAPPSVTPSVKYCQKCGAANDAGVSYCQICGAMSFGPTAQSRIRRPLGVTVLGILQIIGSLIMLLGGGASFVLGLITSARGGEVASLLGWIGLIIFPLAILSMIFAIALFTGRNWARILMIIGAVLDIITIAGILLGIILLWYLTRPRVVAYFKQPK